MFLLEGFENFTVSSWFDKVLTRHVSMPKKKANASTQKRWPGGVVATSLMMALSLPAAAVQQRTIILKPECVESSSSSNKLGGLAPPNYWPTLMGEMKTWEKLPELDFEYPDED